MGAEGVLLGRRLGKARVRLGVEGQAGKSRIGLRRLGISSAPETKEEGRTRGVYNPHPRRVCTHTLRSHDAPRQLSHPARSRRVLNSHVGSRPWLVLPIEALIAGVSRGRSQGKGARKTKADGRGCNASSIYLFLIMTASQATTLVRKIKVA